MPIKTLMRRPPRLGVIHLGVADEAERKGKVVKINPREVPYFVCPPELRKRYGDEPTSLPVLFVSDDVDEILPCWYERYNGKLLTVKCDGETCTTIPLKGPEVVSQCQRPAREYGKPTPECACGAEAKARLNVLVMGGQIGTYQITMGGEQRIFDVMMDLERFKAAFGSLTQVGGRFIPFEVRRVPTEQQIRNEAGDRIARTGYPVRVCSPFTIEQAFAVRGGVENLLAAPPDMKALAEGATEVKALAQTAGAGGPVEQLPLAGADDDAELSAEERKAKKVGDCWTLLLDAGGNNAKRASQLRRDKAKELVGKNIDSLNDLEEADLDLMIRALSA